MTPRIEKRLLQVIVAIACLLPLVVGGMSILRGPAAVGHATDLPIDLDSHFRYLSGIFFGLGLGFASCIPRLEATGPRFRLLGALVVAGGLARGYALVTVGTPSQGHVLGLGMELIVVPLLMVWQAGLARRWKVGYQM